MILWSKAGMMTVYKHFDGPLYVVVAKSFYDPNKIKALKLEIPVSKEYFAAHLPVYPFLIKLVSNVKFLGGLPYLKSMVIVNLLGAMALASFFYWFVQNFKLSKKPLLLATVLIFMPRFLVIRSVGAPESIFMFFILVSIYFFEKEKFWLSGIFGALATATKTPGILLFGAYTLVFVEKIIVKHFIDKESHQQSRIINLNWLGIFLIPIGLLSVFYLYKIQSGDFLAYFHTNANVPMPYIFSVFDWQSKWVGTAWLEDVLFYFFFYLLAIFNLKQIKQRSIFYFSVVFFTAVIFVQHRDISRYSLPFWPMTAIAFEKFFTSKKFLIVFLLLLPAIYLYAWNFLDYNVMPISNWKSFL
ncbi:hypothetical protein B6D29_03400 [Microgenomates bacterium UTCPR1]|nr:MAG: hypothetical protein B6D29_03400 [Microgenomates bacterium UTCPR1]